jgi:hypothetical protein
MGDETEISRVAAYLRSNEQEAKTGQSAVQQGLQEIEGRKEFLKKVNGWMRDTPQMLHDDELYLKAIEFDSQLQRRHPAMDERRRLDMAAALAIDELGDPETRGNSEAIASVVGKNRNYVSQGKVDHDTSQEAGISREHSSIIGQMQKDRESLRETSANAYRFRKEDEARGGRR